MVINKITCYRYSLPLRNENRLGDSTSKARQGLVFALESDASLTGWGEAAPLPGFSFETLETILSKYLEADSVKLIRCGGKKGIDAGREQWNDGSNTLAIAPGEVIVYSRNHVTNRLLESEGIKLHEIPSSELSRGRGGPRCMSMPLFRERL